MYILVLNSRAAECFKGAVEVRLTVIHKTPSFPPGENYLKKPFLEKETESQIL
jgi:hypothetical protein